MSNGRPLSQLHGILIVVGHVSSHYVEVVELIYTSKLVLVERKCNCQVADESNKSMLEEFKTSSDDEQNFCMISSGALKFYVKGEGKAVIGLASCPYDRNEIKIVIGNQYSWIDAFNKVKTVNIMSEHTYNPFWISWYRKEIRIGKGDDPKPFLVKEKLIDISCILFSSFKCNTINWKLRLPPKIEEVIYKKINDGQLKWVKMDGNCLPEDALIGGYENEVLYIMRAMHKKALTPGKYVPSKEAGYVAGEHLAHIKTDIEVLCGYDGIWINSQLNGIPRGALEGGYSEVNCETLYVGRATVGEYLIPGKVQPSHGACYVSCCGLAERRVFHEILVVPCK